MIRPLTLSLAAAFVFFAAVAYGDVETFPVVHNEPITVRVLGGKNGLPLARMHLVLIGGYDRKDMHDQLFRREALTDAQGRVRLPNQMANLPWLQVWVNKKQLCQSNPSKTSFSVELMRRDGLSTPNRCGTATVEDAPGVFTVFVKGKGAAAVVQASTVSASVTIPAAPAMVPALVAIAAAPTQAMTAPAKPPTAMVTVPAQTAAPAPKSEPLATAAAPAQTAATISAKKSPLDAALTPQLAPATATVSCEPTKKSSRCVAVCEHLGAAASGVVRIFH